MNIFTITMVPINPPHDDAAKNIVIGIARRITTHYFYFISSFKKNFAEQSNITFIRSPFQMADRHSMSFFQKIFVLVVVFLMMKRIEIFQFFFTPQTYFSSIFSRLLKKHNKKSIQIVSSIHTLYTKNPKETIPSLFFADYVIAHSEYAKRKLTEAGVKNIVRIYPGIEPERFNIQNLKQKSSASISFSQDDINIIYPGTYTILNNSYSFEKFSKIVLNVTERFNNVRFIMACRTRTKDDFILQRKFKEQAQKFNISRFFKFLNKIDNMPSLLYQCNIGIMPAENQMVGVLEIPMILLEMAALGKPVVYGNTPPLDELEEKGLGIMANNASAENYTDNLSRLLENSKYAAKIGERSKETALRHFNMDTIASEYKKLYDDLESKR